MGDNVFLANLPTDYKVFLFYYPSVIANEDLENGLRKLGDMTGKNLFVNFGLLNDPNYSIIQKTFQIKSFPVKMKAFRSDTGTF